MRELTGGNLLGKNVVPPEVVKVRLLNNSV